ncbi:MAG: hypothetical protein ACJ8HQ_09865 [Chthoniobacterales bacterium]
MADGRAASFNQHLAIAHFATLSVARDARELRVRENGKHLLGARRCGQWKLERSICHHSLGKALPEGMRR